MVDEVRYVDRPEGAVGRLDGVSTGGKIDTLSLITAGPQPSRCQIQRSMLLSNIKLDISVRFSGVPTDRALNRATASPRDCVLGDWRGTWIKLQELTHESQR